jgi:hypothetical protein
MHIEEDERMRVERSEKGLRGLCERYTFDPLGVLRKRTRKPEMPYFF